MTTALISHADCLGHVNPPGHPEQVARLRAIMAALEAEEFAYLVREDAPLASDAEIGRAHPPAHLAALVARAPGEGLMPLDADTFMCPGSLTAARRAAGAVVRAVDMVMAGEVRNAFCAVRPPGHHAERRTPMGFCLFGNVVIGARHALEAHGLARVAIVDFDVHHGNGTQDLVWDDPRILFASTHQMPLYPGSGAADESGRAWAGGQCAAAARCGRAAGSGRRCGQGAAGGRGARAGDGADLGRVRCPCPRSAGQPEPDARRISPGRRSGSATCGRAMARGGSSRLSKADMI